MITLTISLLLFSTFLFLGVLLFVMKINHALTLKIKDLEKMLDIQQKSLDTCIQVLKDHLERYTIFTQDVVNILVPPEQDLIVLNPLDQNKKKLN